MDVKNIVSILKLLLKNLLRRVMKCIVDIVTTESLIIATGAIRTPPTETYILIVLSTLFEPVIIANLRPFVSSITHMGNSTAYSKS